MQSVLSHWVAWGTGSFVVLVLAFLDQVYGWRIPRILFVIFLALGLLISCFQAWQDQYRENEAARTAGSLVLVNLEGTLFKNDQGKDGLLQVGTVLRNVQSRLIEYHVDKFDLTIESKPAELHFLNRGGYVYAISETVFRSSRVPISDTSKWAITGTLQYAISYHTAGSEDVHHTSKSLNFDFFTSPTSMKFLTAAEHED